MRGGRDGGQTLIEMLVVLAILTIVGLLIFPALENTIGALQFRRSVDLLESDLRAARATAIAGHQTVRLALARDGQSYAVSVGVHRQAPNGVRYAGLPETVAFFADGSSTGGTVRIVWGGRRMDLRVDPVTGAVTGSQQ